MTVVDWSSPDDELISLFERGGFVRVETPVLQPASVFLDLSGEDIRRRLYLTQGAGGQELCLRPEYTIPVCLRHLARGEPLGEYCYLGPVFRQRGDEPGEFLQAGIESIGRADRAPTEAEVLASALEGVRIYTSRPLDVVVGDMGLVSAVFDSLGLPRGARRRLGRALAAGEGLASALAPAMVAGASDHAGLLAAISGQDPEAARAFVEDVISVAGIATVGGRSAGEIAERFLARSASPSDAMPAASRDVLERVFAVAGDLDDASQRLRTIAAEARLDLTEALDRLDERTGFMAARGIDVAKLRFKVDFARSLDYYTGLIFEIRDPARDDGKPLAAGGRYDGLLGQLGAGEPVPAVGCSFWLDRLTERPR